jgi:signal transduction histidine kinase
MTNVARHASASRVEARLALKGDGVELVVSDDGRGISEEEIASPRSIGLIGMRERLRPWGGEIRIEGRQGKGTTVTVHIPLENEERGE